MADSPLAQRLKHLGHVAWEKLRDPRFYVTDVEWERDSLERGVFNAKNLVLFGDSQAARWPLRRTFGRLPIRGRGLDGDQVDVALQRFEQAVIPLQPSAVLILLGADDLGRGQRANDIAADLCALARRAITAGVRPTLCSVLPAGVSRESQRPTSKVLELNQQIRRDCGDLGLFYLDLVEKVADGSGRLRADLTFDGFHPNLPGYLRMTEAVLEVFYCRSGQWKRGAPRVW